MFHFNMRPEFRARATDWVGHSRFAGKVSTTLRNTVVGGVAGWGVAIVVGAVMMTHAGHEPPAPAPALAVAAPKPAPTPAIDTAPVAAIAQVAPAPAPSPAKTTQRVDTTPTGATAAEAAPKPKHKPHKKKPKDLDSAQ